VPSQVPILVYNVHPIFPQNCLFFVAIVETRAEWSRSTPKLMLEMSKANLAPRPELTCLNFFSKVAFLWNIRLSVKPRSDQELNQMPHMPGLHLDHELDKFQKLQRSLTLWYSCDPSTVSRRIFWFKRSSMKHKSRQSNSPRHSNYNFVIQAHDT